MHMHRLTVIIYFTVYEKRQNNVHMNIIGKNFKILEKWKSLPLSTVSDSQINFFFICDWYNFIQTYLEPYLISN